MKPPILVDFNRCRGFLIIFEQQKRKVLEITLDKKTNTEGLIKIKLSEGDYQPNVEEKVKDYAKRRISKVSVRVKCLPV